MCLGEETFQKFSGEIKPLHPKPIKSEVKQDTVWSIMTYFAHNYSFPFQLAIVSCSNSHRFSSCLSIATLKAAGLNCVQKSTLPIFSERVIDTVNSKGY